jgi:hypothetical protein
MASRVTSNRSEVVAGVRRLGAGFSLKGRGRSKSFAEDLSDAISQQIADRTALAQQDPDGRPLAPLAAATLRRKARLGYPETIGVERGLMLSQAELKGESVVTDTSMEMTYGAGEQAKKEAEWFTEGSARRGQPPRRFYELDNRENRDLDALTDEALDRQATELGCE